MTGPIPDLPFAPVGDDIVHQIAELRPRMPFGNEVSGLDTPLHAPMRSPLMPLFTPGRLNAMDAGFRRIAEESVA